MVGAGSPNTLVHNYQTIQHHIPEGSNHHSHCLENPKSQKNFTVVNNSLPDYVTKKQSIFIDDVWL
jgi:hypothetical protein